MRTLYYTKKTEFFSGIRTLTLYAIESNELIVFAELECLAYLGENLLTDGEEIQAYLDENGYEEEEFEFIEL